MSGNFTQYLSETYTQVLEYYPELKLYHENVVDVTITLDGEEIFLSRGEGSATLASMFMAGMIFVSRKNLKTNNRVKNGKGKII